MTDTERQVLLLVAQTVAAMAENPCAPVSASPLRKGIERLAEEAKWLADRSKVGVFARGCPDDAV